ncbi:MAG: hypothetical protein ABI782_04295 [Anaerolineaceae bacterium]
MDDNKQRVRGAEEGHGAPETALSLSQQKARQNEVLKSVLRFDPNTNRLQGLKDLNIPHELVVSSSSYASTEIILPGADTDKATWIAAHIGKLMEAGDCPQEGIVVERRGDSFVVRLLTPGEQQVIAASKRRQRDRA